jgi:hypothetical protein
MKLEYAIVYEDVVVEIVVRSKTARGHSFCTDHRIDLDEVIAPVREVLEDVVDPVFRAGDRKTPPGAITTHRAS